MKHCSQCGLPLKEVKKFKRTNMYTSGYTRYRCEDGHEETLMDNTTFRDKEDEEIRVAARKEKASLHIGRD